MLCRKTLVTVVSLMNILYSAPLTDIILILTSGILHYACVFYLTVSQQQLINSPFLHLLPSTSSSSSYHLPRHLLKKSRTIKHHQQQHQQHHYYQHLNMWLSTKSKTIIIININNNIIKPVIQLPCKCSSALIYYNSIELKKHGNSVFYINNSISAILDLFINLANPSLFDFSIDTTPLFTTSINGSKWIVTFKTKLKKVGVICEKPLECLFFWVITDFLLLFDSWSERSREGLGFRVRSLAFVLIVLYFFFCWNWKKTHKRERERESDDIENHVLFCVIVVVSGIFCMNFYECDVENDEED